MFCSQKECECNRPRESPQKKKVTATAASSRDRRPSDENRQELAGSRDRRPSDKVAAQRMLFYYCIHYVLDDFFFLGAAQREKEQLKADKEQRQALCKKKTLQKSNQQAGIATDSDDEFEARANPMVCFFFPLSLSINDICSSTPVRWLPNFILCSEVASSLPHELQPLLKNW